MAEQQFNQSYQNNENEIGGSITLHDIVRVTLANWYWFAISVFICLGVAYFYLASTPRIYSRAATILVKDSRKGGDIDLGAFSDLAGFQSRRNVDNEVYILQSQRLMTEVVTRLNLTTNYSTRQRLRTIDLYGRSPIEVNFIDANENSALSLRVTDLGGDNVRLSDFSNLKTDEQSSQTIDTQYGATVEAPIGLIVVNRVPMMDSTLFARPITVTKNSLQAATNIYRRAVNTSIVNKLASIVVISMNSSVPRKAEDVINTLIQVYEEDAIADKRKISIVTAEFIRERMETLGRELGDVDRNIADVKKSNQMIDLSTEAARSVRESSQFKADGLSLENQLSVARFIQERLNNPSQAGELIPAITTLNNTSITSQIADYNEAVLRRRKLLENSSERSPVIQDIDNLLSAVRRSIITSLDSHISTLNIQLENMRREEAQANRRIQTMPTQERVMLDIARQQKIKEELYLYLLGKQEEIQLNYAVAESNSRTIDAANGSSIPVSPRSIIILAVSLMAGLAIPFAIIYLIGILDTTIRGRKDVEEHISAPFLGDIPYLEGERNEIVVREAGRDPVSEAFRILRSNMTFMNVSSGKEMKCILVTSAEPHAGKTFVAMNLAMTLAIAGKRVILIDLDLRRHALSSQQGNGKNQKGVTGYLSGSVTNIDELISNMNEHMNLDIIYAGIQPPNPTEMLLSEKLDELIAKLRSRYNYIIIDSTPSMSVADAFITGRLSDLCIYVLREGMMDRRQLPDIERLYQEKRFHNMAVVLNGTRLRQNSYGYGYGYSYGYGYDKKDKGSYRKRIKLFFRKLRGKN